MVKIITDSSSDITPEYAAGHGIGLVPLTIQFGDTSYTDGVDIDTGRFYDMLAAAPALPRTSQPSPEAFLPLFREAAENGDEVVAILIAGKLSGTIQSANIAKSMCGYEHIHIVDSNNTIVGLRLLVDEAVKLRDRGLSAAEIAAAVEEMSRRIILVAMVDTLEYLYKGGRLSRATRIAGSILNFKPLLRLEDGELGLIGKARGVKKAIEKLMEIVDTLPAPQPGVPFYFGYTATSDKCDLLMEMTARKFDISDRRICPVGPAVGTHVGPGACVLVYLAQA